MTDVSAVIRATQASARALSAMNRAASQAADASATLAHNLRLVANGRISGETAAIGNRIAYARKQQASLNYYRAKRRYLNAQKVLALNPLPGDESK